MNPSKRRKHTEIPLVIGEDLKYVKGVTRYTTCADVIKMVIKKTDISMDENQPEGFGIYESSRGIERLLPAKCRVLKIMRSWGADNEYKLLFRKVNTELLVPRITGAKRRKLINRRREAQGGTLAELNEVKHGQFENNCNFVTEIYLKDSENNKDISTPRSSRYFRDSVALETMNDLSSTRNPDFSRNITGQSDDSGLVHGKNATCKYNVNDVKFAIRKTLKTKQIKIEHSAAAHVPSNTRCQKIMKGKCLNIKRHERLANHVVAKVSRMNQKEGKEALLQKYFADYITYRSPQNTHLDSRFRERGDGAESSSEESKVHPISPRREADETSNEDNSNDSNDVSSDSGQEDDSCGLDTAFMINQHEDECEISFECTVPNVGPVNDYNQDVGNIETISCCHGNRLVDYSLSEEDFVMTDDGNEIDETDDDIHDISSVSDVVKSIFSDNKDADEDDEMESFMRTKLFDEYSDEGLSSLGSDDEKEILV